jgi:alpha(1,3/1,4) fucosyltransferase
MKAWHERNDFFHLLTNKYKKVDSGGKALNSIGGLVNDKLAFQRECKFSIAFENSSYPGYTTEKILHAFVADTIPIYWGNPLVHKDFNTKAFINCHDYNNFDEVVDRVIEIDNNDELYLQYLKEPALAIDNNEKYLDEEKILDKFEEIFNDIHSKPIRKKTDILKYYSPKFIYYHLLDKEKMFKRKTRMKHNKKYKNRL